MNKGSLEAKLRSDWRFVRKRFILEKLGAAAKQTGRVSGVWEVSIFGVDVSFVTLQGAAGQECS